MKVLFVNPPTTTCLNETKSGKQYIEENIGNQFFPLSKIPFEVVHKLKDVEGIEKDILLLDFEWYKNPNLSKEELINLIMKRNPDIILTTLIAQASTDTLDWITTRLKEKSPDLIVIVGGQAITHLQEKIFNFCPNIDFALIGNSDKQLPKLVKELSLRKKDFKNIKGLIYKKRNKIMKNNINKEELITYSKEIYSPYKNLLKEMVKVVKDGGAFVLGSEEFSKGCPFQCLFCAAKRKYKGKNILKVISTINYLCSIGINKFYIEDLTFGVSLTHRKKILEELKKIKENNKEFGFRCVTRADLITKKFVEQLEEAGCYEVGLGIECNEGIILNLMNKKASIDKNIEALETLGKSKLSFKLFLIEGYPHSNTLTSKRTFELLNYLEKRKYNYFIQPALNRDIVPSQKKFKGKEQKGILKRGTCNQLDFRHDCRNLGWDSDRTIRSMCLLMLAYPSTELGKKNKDLALQKRITLDLPFLKDKTNISNILNFIKSLPIKPNNKKTLYLRKDLIHFIDGVYTTNELKHKLRKLYPNLAVNKEGDYCLNKLREKMLIDSFGNPNIGYANYNNHNTKYKTPKRKENIFLFWNGNNQRYIYAPLNKKVIKIKTCFYKNIPEEVFEFLILSKGFYSVKEISTKLHNLFKEKEGFENLKEAEKTTNKIYLTCKEYGLCY